MSEHPPVSPKKRRLDDDADGGDLPSSTEITRCQELWFDDGNIVLQAENTQFRVHRGPISMHSLSFKDMFLIPQPEGEARVEDCPVIRVYDRAKDWENLLMAMYNNFKTNPMQRDYPIDRILSLARLGHKYQFNHFRDITTEYLIEAFPITLDEWDSSDAHIEYSKEVDPDGEECFTSGFEIELINTAMEVGLHSILPALFFCVYERLPNEFFHGHENQDGTLWKLAPHLQETLLSVRHRICRRSTLATILRPLSEVANGRETRQIVCESPAECRTRSRAADSRMLLLQFEPGAALQKPEDLYNCVPCNKFVRSRMEVGRNHIWDKLPRYFDLPKWDEAEDLKG